jgi:RNA polymerase sigma-70 factor (ECF subfamily)
VSQRPFDLNGRECFEAFYDAYHRQAFGVAYRLLGRSGDAEDVVQEAFLSAWRSFAVHPPMDGASGRWLLAIVRNRAIDVLRARRRRPEQALDPQVPVAAGYDVPVQAISHMDGERTREALGTLPPEQCEVLELAFFRGLTHVEIAERLELPLGTVKGRLRLGLSRVRRVLLDEREPSRSA